MQYDNGTNFVVRQNRCSTIMERTSWSGRTDAVQQWNELRGQAEQMQYDNETNFLIRENRCSTTIKRTSRVLKKKSEVL